MKRRLVETLEVQIVLADNNAGFVTENMCAEWGSVTYPELSVMLVHLRHLALLHQTHHWTAKGDPFYGDHLLFERLYSSVTPEIDSVAEKAIGLGTTANVDVALQTMQLNKLVQNYGMSQMIPTESDLARRSLIAEYNFLVVVAKLVELMKESGTLTRGLDNLIAGIEDQHEGNCYLLKQRCSLG